MSPFNKNNLTNIKNIFEEKANVDLTARKPIRRTARNTAVLSGFIACCFTMTAFAISLFSSLSGDDLGLYATYEGNGIVSIIVENRSDKELDFQPALKLMRWKNNEEVEPFSDNMVFDGRKIPADSIGTMTIDLSKAYNRALSKLWKT